MNGRYVIRIGKYYISRVREEYGSADITLEQSLREAMFMNLEGAKRLKENFGGEIVKMKLEMEPVE